MEFLMHESHGLELMFDYDKTLKEAQIAIAMGISAYDCLTAPYEPTQYLKNGWLRAPIQIIIISIELGLKRDEVLSKWYEIRKKKNLQEIEMSKTPIKEGRDNKDVKVGSGGSSGNSIRYPSKKRSKRVWKNFYKLFPWLAIKDEWNGEKSKRTK